MAKRLLRDFEDVSVRPDSIDGRVDFGRIFGRPAPVHIEIGSGKGTFLLNQGRLRPEINFLGIERASKYCRWAVDRIGRAGLSNVRIIRTEACQFICRHVGDDSIDCFHVYFPDPWPKKRHHKRRFVCQANMEQMLRCLKTGGAINIATDHEDYFGQIRDVIAQMLKAGSVGITDYIRPAFAIDGELAGTNYERKYIRDGRNIYTVAVRKR